MKTVSLISTGTLCLAMFACSTAATPPPPTETTGGAASTAGGQATSVTGGTTNASGGASSLGGDTSDLGGSPTASGGTGGSGGSDSTTAGGSSTTGGTGTATGGTGTTAGGSTSAGGGTGTSGGSGGSGTVDTTLVGSWDGALLEFPCGSTGTSYDCQQPASAACVSVFGKTTGTVSTIPATLNGQPAVSTWTMGGTAGTMYDVTVHITGVVEPYAYVGGTRDKGQSSVQSAASAGLTTGTLDLFMEGGTPQDHSSNSNGSDYNIYELDVVPAAGGAGDTYHLNSVATNENPHTSPNVTQHLTFAIDYSKHIKVPGGGKVTLKMGDSNCTEVQNCKGGATNNMCTNHWTPSLAGSTPAPPASFSQPFGDGTRFGQWVFFDITNVAVAQ